MVRLDPRARLLIIGQAPGTRVHETGLPWDDRSGDQLRAWLGLDREAFYDVSRIAIMPMGFCYPGRDKNGGDAPPRPECAPFWHPQLRPRLPNIGLTLLVGGYAQSRYLGRTGMTETVRAFARFAPDYFPLPHPSWRNTAWQKRQPWFVTEVLPALRARVATLFA